MQNRTEKALADALISLCAERPFSEIGVRDVCARCGLSRQSFYNHFPDKYALVDRIFIAEALEPAAEPGRRGSFARVMAARLSALKKNLRFYQRVLQDNSFQDSFYAALRQALCALVTARSASGAPDDDVAFQIDFYCRGCVRTVSGWLLSGAKTPVHELAEALENCLPDGLARYLSNDYLSDYL